MFQKLVVCFVALLGAQCFVSTPVSTQLVASHGRVEVLVKKAELLGEWTLILSVTPNEGSRINLQAPWMAVVDSRSQEKSRKLELGKSPVMTKTQEESEARWEIPHLPYKPQSVEVVCFFCSSEGASCHREVVQGHL